MPVLQDSPISARSIIERALRLMGQIAPGVTPTAAEYADGLEALNSLLDELRNEKIICLATRDESFNMVVGQSVYTIGPTGDLNTERPVRIDGAYVVDSGGTSHGVVLYTDLQYAAIPLKDNPGPWPDRVYYEATSPIGSLYTYPVVEQSGCVFHVITWVPVEIFADLDDDMVLAPGWFSMLCYNLAVDWIAEFEREASATVQKKAVSTKAFIKRANNQTPKASFDPSLRSGSGWIDWRSGEPI